jgi:hypothetical protein
MHFTMLYSIQDVAPFVAIYFIVYHLAINLVGISFDVVDVVRVARCPSSACLWRNVYSSVYEQEFVISFWTDCALAFRGRYFGQSGT